MKVTSPYRVRVVVDPAYGERLASLPPREPIWVIDTPTNKPVVQRLWRERTGGNHLTGITTFKPDPSLAPDEEIAFMLSEIEDHHGEASADPPYSVLEIIGCGLTDRLMAALSDYDFSIESSAEDHVVAVRPT